MTWTFLVSREREMEADAGGRDRRSRQIEEDPCIGAHSFTRQFSASTPNCWAYEAGAEALPLCEERWPGPAMKLDADLQILQSKWKESF
ncbi:MAG: hypothetical protein ACYDBH_21030 [Acidobacteriaceae bacterium]